MMSSLLVFHIYESLVLAFLDQNGWEFWYKMHGKIVIKITH